MSGAELKISNDVYENIMKMPEIKGVIKVTDLGGAINLSSMEYILPEEKAEQANINKANARIKLHDGGYAIKKFGQWVDENTEAKIDLNYYKYLAKDLTHDEYLKLEKEKEEEIKKLV